MNKVSKLVRETVVAEVERGQKRLDDWNARLVSHALAVRRGQLAQRAYADEVERWRRRFRRELVGLHLKGAAAGLGVRSRLQGEVLERVTAELSEPLARVDALARAWIEQPPEDANRSELARGETGQIDLLRSALGTFDLVRGRPLGIRSAVWEEWKHPRDEKGRFGHAGLHSEGLLEPVTKVSTETLLNIIKVGPLAPVYHATARDAREHMLQLDKQYAVRRRYLKDRGKKIFDRLTEINTEFEHRKKLNPNTTPLSSNSEYLRLLNEEEEIDAECIPMLANLRRELWNQIAVQSPTKFRLEPKDIIDLPPEKQQHVHIGVWLAQQLIDKKIVADTMLRFENTIESTCKYRMGKICLGNSSAPHLVAHEMGHHLDHYSRELEDALVGYRENRVEEAKKDGRLARNAKPRPLPGYREGVVVLGYEKVFFDNYFSRYYPLSNKTELLSMGLEYYINDPLTLINEDPRLFDFLYNILRGKSSKEN